MKIAVVVLLLGLLAGPVWAQGNAVPRWEAGTTAQGEAMRRLLQGDPLHQLLPARINSLYRLPRDLPIIYIEDGKLNASYTPSQHKIVVSYDLVAFLLRFFRSHGVADPEQRTRETVAFILLHEFAHALIGELQLPAVGREEDAADELATLLAEQILGDQGVQSALTAAQWFQLMGSSQIKMGELQFWDEHSLDRQRFFKILCLVYGANPAGTEHIVKPLVPLTRLMSAQKSHPDKMRRWQRLLGSHRQDGMGPKLHQVFPNPQQPRSLTYESISTNGALLPVADLVRIRGFGEMIGYLNGKFRLPKNLFVNYRDTDVAMNMFLPLTGKIVLSRQFFDSAEKRLAGLPTQQRQETMRALEQVSLLQEFSRGLISDADLAITGEPEAAAAELTTLMIVSDPSLRRLAVPLSRWFDALAREKISVLQLRYWSESALDQQSYYDLLGYLYCADPSVYPQAARLIPRERLHKMAWELPRKKLRWKQLLQPFGGPF
jgi:Putative metallopeptidase